MKRTLVKINDNCWVNASAVDAVQDITECYYYSSTSHMTIVILRSGEKLTIPGWRSEEICKKLDAMEV